MSSATTLTGPPIMKPTRNCAKGSETLAATQLAPVWESHFSACGAFQGALAGTLGAIAANEAAAAPSSATRPISFRTVRERASRDVLRCVVFPSRINVALPDEYCLNVFRP